jgi:RNA polymerase sigma factor (sigma-70 family)
MEAHAIPRPRAQGRQPVRYGLLTDERLARLVTSGDQRAFATLYERYHQPLYRYCRSLLRHEADAQDAMQSALTGAYGALRRDGRDAPVRPWLFRIAHNEAISVLRRRRPDVELTDAIPHLTEALEQQGEQRERLALLVADLLELPERQRGALVMRELSGLSHDEIAVALGTSVGAAKQAIFEARRALAEFVEGRAMSCVEVCRIVSDADGRALRARRVRAHLRDCAACRELAGAIPVRSADLRALAPPLPAAAAAGLLSQILTVGGSTVGGGSSVGGAAGVAGAMTGKTAVLGLAAKGLAGLAVVSAATVAITRSVEHRAVSSNRPGTAAITHHSVAGGTVGQRTHARAGSGPSTRYGRHGAAARTIGSGHSSAQQAQAGHGGGVGLRITASGSLKAASSNSGVAAGHTFTSPGKSSTSPGKAGTSAGKGGTPPAKSSTSLGKAGTSPGRAGTSPGQSHTHGKSLLTLGHLLR